MDENGQVYFGPEDELPAADKQRYADEVEALRVRVEGLKGARLGILNTPGITDGHEGHGVPLTPEDIYAAVKKLEEPE